MFSAICALYLTCTGSLWALPPPLRIMRPLSRSRRNRWSNFTSAILCRPSSRCRGSLDAQSHSPERTMPVIDIRPLTCCETCFAWTLLEDDENRLEFADCRHRVTEERRRLIISVIFTKEQDGMMRMRPDGRESNGCAAQTYPAPGPRWTIGRAHQHRIMRAAKHRSARRSGPETYAAQTRPGVHDHSVTHVGRDDGPDSLDRERIDVNGRSTRCSRQYVSAAASPDIPPDAPCADAQEHAKHQLCAHLRRPMG